MQTDLADHILMVTSGSDSSWSLFKSIKFHAKPASCKWTNCKDQIIKIYVLSAFRNDRLYL